MARSMPSPATEVQYNVAAIGDLIRSAFDAPGLWRFLRDRPAFAALQTRIRLEDDLETMLDQIIEHCRTRALFAELLREIEADNPVQYERYRPQLVLAPGRSMSGVPAAPSAPVGQGLVALVELMQSPRVRDAVRAFDVDFRAAKEQIDVLTDYKALHDLLHSLQFNCYAPIVQEARRFPGDDLAVDNLMEYELTFQRIVAELEQVAGRASFAAGDFLWIEELAQACQMLGQAFETRDPQFLKQTIWLSNRVLAIQPAQINARLNATARVLRLPALIRAMTDIHDDLGRFDLDADRMAQFHAGLLALVDLSQKLAGLVDDHDRWQAVDVELRRIETNFGRDALELVMSWPHLQVMVAPLHRDDTGQWALSLRRCGDNLDRAIAAGDAGGMNRYFRLYRRQVGIRFHQVDVSLKMLCGELQKIADPLALVMRG